MSPPVVIVGSGGHAKVVLAMLRRLGHRVLGLLDADPATHGGSRLGVPVLGGDEWMLAQGAGFAMLANGVGAIGRPVARQAVFRRFREAGFAFVTIVDPSALIEPDTRLGEGVQVMKGAIIQPGVDIGQDAIVNTGAILDHDCRIGAHSHIAPGCVLSGGVTVGEASLVGSGSSVRQGIAIGAGTVVGSGSVVVADLPDGVTAYGNPAKVVSS